LTEREVKTPGFAVSERANGGNGNDRAHVAAADLEQLQDPVSHSAPARRRRSRRSPMLRREMTFRRLLGVADAFAISIALVFSALVLGDGRLAFASLLVPPLFIATAKTLGLYDRDEHLLHKTTLDELPSLLALTTLSSMLLWLSGSAVVEGSLGRGQVLGMWLLLFVLTIVLRSIARLVARRTSAVERCLFVGAPSSAETVRAKLAASPAVKAELVGWLPFDPTDFNGTGAGRVLPQRIRAVVSERAVERVILGPNLSHSEELLDSIRRIKDHGLKVSVLPDATRVVDSAIEIDRLNGITLLGVRQFEITRSSRVIKRTFDVGGSVLALALSSPLLLLVAVAIKIDSPGPVLFRQRRAGRHGAPFSMLKFRSMVDGADAQQAELSGMNEADGVFKISGDPRITRVGRLIRKLYLDELPQLVNVVRGEMSLVGPRPLPLEEDRRIEGWHRRRLDIAPGMTGPWQILGSSRVPVSEMVHLDYQYVADWSLWNDIRILLLTVGRVFRGRGM
jgi:exopolysaccharide biosynthesis polyprenyl glycosylphosphotransferase